MSHDTTRRRISDLVARIMAKSPLVLDTETTGIGADAEIVEIAVLDSDGQTMLNTLIRPTLAIPEEATAVHGITNEEVASCRAFDAIIEPLADLLEGRHLVIYNVDFDMKMMNQSLRARRAAIPDWRALQVQPFDAMIHYAEWYGEKNDWNSWKWQKLSDAAEQCGIEPPPDLHRARADCELTLRVMRHMGGAS